jgi:hypothetical protein
MSMCRVQTAHDGLESYHAFRDKAFPLLGDRVWDGPAMFRLVEQSEGEVIAEAILARESLPLPPE